MRKVGCPQSLQHWPRNVAVRSDVRSRMRGILSMARLHSLRTLISSCGYARSEANGDVHGATVVLSVSPDVLSSGSGARLRTWAHD